MEGEDGWRERMDGGRGWMRGWMEGEDGGRERERWECTERGRDGGAQREGGGRQGERGREREGAEKNRNSPAYQCDGLYYMIHH